MRKIKLDLETLDVLSFATDTTPAERGSVEGQAATDFCTLRTCDGMATCAGETCGVAYSCVASCGACDTYECTGEGSTIGTYPTNQSGIGCHWG